MDRQYSQNWGSLLNKTSTGPRTALDGTNKGSYVQQWAKAGDDDDEMYFDIIC